MSKLIVGQKVIKTDFERQVQNWLNIKFKAGWGRWRLASEKRRYRIADKSIWEQTKGDTPEVVEIYLRIGDLDYYVADVNNQEPPWKAFITVNNGLEKIKKDLEQETKMNQKSNKIILPKGGK